MEKQRKLQFTVPEFEVDCSLRDAESLSRLRTFSPSLYQYADGKLQLECLMKSFPRPAPNKFDVTQKVVSRRHEGNANSFSRLQKAECVRTNKLTKRESGTEESCCRLPDTVLQQ